MAEILNIDTGKVYSSIEAAARAAGVDPSNVGKVLRGQRKSAGGFRFQRVQADSLSAEQVQDIRREIEKNTPKRIKEKQQRQRQRYETARAAQLRGIQQSIYAANRIIQEYKRENVYSIGKAVSELIGAGEVIGIRKSGLIKTDLETIKQRLSEVEDIKKLQRLQEQFLTLAKEAEKQLSSAIQDKKDLADQLGLSSLQIDKYMHYMPEFFEILELSNIDGRLSSEFVYKTVKNYMQSDISNPDLRKLFGVIRRFLDNPNAGDQDALEKRIQRFEQRRKEREEGGEFNENDLPKFNP